MTIAVDDRRLLLFAKPPWVLDGAASDMWFAQGLYFKGLTSSLSVTRASTGYAQDSLGNLINFASGVPRITNQGLLVEEARINIVPGSQNVFNNGTFWTTANASVSDGSLGAPDGSSSASTLTDNNANLVHGFFAASSISYTNTTVYVFSCFVKAGTLGFAQLFAPGAAFSGLGFVNINLSTGATQTGGTVVAAGSQQYINGWWRVWMAITATATTATTGGGINTVTSLAAARGQAYIGTNSTIGTWGFDVQAGSFPLSYIPTTTTSATRAADNISLSGTASSILAATQGAVVIWSTLGQAARAGTLLDSNGNIVIGETAANKLTTAITAGLTTGNTATWTGAVGSGVAWDQLGRTLILNNGAAATDSQATTPAVAFHLGSISGTSAFFDGYIRRIAVFNSKLPATSLGPLTVAQ